VNDDDLGTVDEPTHHAHHIVEHFLLVSDEGMDEKREEEGDGYVGWEE
jgi:hypothetical protein